MHLRSDDEPAFAAEKGYCYGSLLGIRCGAHYFQRLVVLTLRGNHPCPRNLPLNIDLLGSRYLSPLPTFRAIR